MSIDRITHLIEQMHRSEDDAGDPIVVGKHLVTDGARGFTWEDATGSGSLPWFNIRDYGAVGDGSTDDRTEINSAIAALNAAGGGVLYVPAVASGDYYYVSNSLTTITVPCLILGDGGGSAGPSIVATDHATAFLFTLSASNIRMTGLKLINFGGSETDGAAFRTTTGFGNNNRYDHLWIEGFRDGFLHRHGGEWSMSDSMVTNPVRYGANIANEDIPDGGDWSIVNTWFGTRTRDATDAIHVDSAGGGKLANVKVNCNLLADQGGGVKRYVDGYKQNVNGSANGTSVLTIVGCSFENISGDAIDISTTGTGFFGNVSITGVEFGLYSNNAGRCVKLAAATNGAFPANGSLGVVVLDALACHTSGTARAAIELTNTDRVTLGDIVLSGFNARYTSSGDTNTTDGSAQALNDLTDVTITSVQEDDQLQYVGGVWVNSAKRWEAVTDGEDVFVWDGDDLAHEWKEY